MPGQGDSKGPFLLGVTMAGAVSAGAYTAGVLDFLLRALDAHNDRCDPNASPDDMEVPRHRVVLKTMSGASAGGVCTGLAIAGLIGNQQPGKPRLGKPTTAKSDPGAGYSYSYSYTFDALHEVWVEALDLWRPASQQGFLAFDDLLDQRQQVQSVLNGSHIDDVAGRALEDIRWGGEDAPGQPYSFLADEIDMFLTTTNLMGVPYEVGFAGTGGGGHRMAQHGTVRHFRIKGLGEHTQSSHWLNQWKDDGIALDLPAPGDRLPFDDPTTDWSAFKASTIATGAFPIGLAPRLIEAEARDFGVIDPAVRARGGAMPIDIDPAGRHPARPDFGNHATPETPVRYVAVDGGVANNEPFEFARFTLRAEDKKTGGFLKKNPREADKADRAVIMIDPFPEGPEHVSLTREEAETYRGLVPTLKRLLPTLIDQARFKPAELMNAADVDVHSRFMIAPSRSGDTDDGAVERAPLAGSKAIASGAFGGFSGFFDHSFRVHDFILGQRNCQRFLQEHFMLDASNPVLNLPDKMHKDAGGKILKRRVIDPGPEMLKPPIPLPDWPRIGNERLKPMLKQAERRLGGVGTRLVRQEVSGWVLRFAIGIFWSIKWPVLGIKARVHKLLIKIVMSEFVRRDQHADYKGLSPDMREIMISLLDQGDRPATVRDLIRDAENRTKRDSSGLNPGDVEDTLVKLCDGQIVWRAPKRGDHHRYTHIRFRPGWIKRAGLLIGSATGFG
ncbi:MAG: hypothetical protein ACU0B1_02745 [Thermohalobaculum sp.]